MECRLRSTPWRSSCAREVNMRAKICPPSMVSTDLARLSCDVFEEQGYRSRATFPAAQNDDWLMGMNLDDLQGLDSQPQGDDMYISMFVSPTAGVKTELQPVG
ncbi:hypothetical protein GUJ93_ZPchr0007g5976 [Zizania palustris]|uniref:Uncharacterized protein n=1 Tax=Zizania palustris TaxID=103762 RepID=A0A8J5SVA7_ZIZPA|nr:hypothetical protein GUJ93_ZPchr0007g5976 [Zizania palustris]